VRAAASFRYSEFAIAGAQFVIEPKRGQADICLRIPKAKAAAGGRRFGRACK
jgi:hypothetical protein